MTDPARPLDLARRDLALRAQEAEEDKDWDEAAVLVPLSTVADMVCRIGDHTHSAHYRADKASDLVDAARRVEVESLRAYAAYGGADAALDSAAEVLEAVGSVVRWAMWVAARRANGTGAEVYADDVRRIRRAQSAFGAWADTVCAGAVPNPVE